jgi:hypothetical protein
MHFFLLFSLSFLKHMFSFFFSFFCSKYIWGNSFTYKVLGQFFLKIYICCLPYRQTGLVLYIENMCINLFPPKKKREGKRRHIDLCNRLDYYNNTSNEKEYNIIIIIKKGQKVWIMEFLVEKKW